MNARSNPKKISKTSKEKDKKLYNKLTTPVEENEITIHISEDDRSIVTDKAEENQPIMDPKPNNTSTPKRKAMEDHGPPKKKPTLEDSQNKEIDIGAIDDEIEEIEEKRPRESKKVELQLNTVLNTELQKSMKAYMGKMMAEPTKRLDTLEKS